MTRPATVARIFVEEGAETARAKGVDIVVALVGRTPIAVEDDDGSARRGFFEIAGDVTLRGGGTGGGFVPRNESPDRGLLNSRRRFDPATGKRRRVNLRVLREVEIDADLSRRRRPHRSAPVEPTVAASTKARTYVTLRVDQTRPLPSTIQIHAAARRTGVATGPQRNPWANWFRINIRRIPRFAHSAGCESGHLWADAPPRSKHKRHRGMTRSQTLFRQRGQRGFCRRLDKSAPYPCAKSNHVAVFARRARYVKHRWTPNHSVARRSTATFGAF